MVERITSNLVIMALSFYLLSNAYLTGPSRRCNITDLYYNYVHLVVLPEAQISTDWVKRLIFDNHSSCDEHEAKSN